MGLDTVELVMEVEAAFDITIRDEDAEKLITVGMLYDYVLARLDDAAEVERPLPCLGAAGFYPLRRALIEFAGVERPAVRLATPLSDFLPRDDRRARWLAIERALGLVLPELERPTWVRWGVAGVYGVPCVILMLLWMRAGVFDPGRFPVPILLWIFVCGPVCIFGILAVTRPLARKFPGCCQTVRGLAEVVARTNYARLARRGRGWNREEVRDVLRSVIARVLGVSPEAVTMDAQFVKDLGAD